MKKIWPAIFEKIQFECFYLVKLFQELEAKLLFKVLFSVTENANTPNVCLLHIQFKKKSVDLIRIPISPYFIGNGKNPFFIVRSRIYYRIKLFPIPNEMKGWVHFKNNRNFFLKLGMEKTKIGSICIFSHMERYFA